MSAHDEILDSAWPTPPRVDGLTGEQQGAVDLFHDGDHLAIEAGAGTGKTTTLVAMARTTDAIGYYVAFNKDVVLDVGAKLPENVTASTAHSLAFRSVGNRYAHRIGTGRIKSWDIARRLGIDPMVVSWEHGRKRLAADFLAGLVMRSLRTFSYTADERPSPRHVPYVDGIDMPDDGGRTWINNNIVRDYLGQFLERAWQDVTKVDGQLPFTHDHYLKMWHLSGPRIPAEFILLDEAQDLSPVMLAIAGAQDAQLVFVGDSQQQIYDWRGAVNALASIGKAQRAFLTQSFRFGQPIADVANRVLDELDAELRLTGNPAQESSVGACDPDVVLTRTNAEAVSTVLAFQKAGTTVHLVGGSLEVVSFARAAQDLIDGRKTWHPELACFDSWGEVQEYVARDPQGDELRLMVKLVDEYGTPTILIALDNMISEAQADVIVSTAHKAKGREWARVRLGGDYPPDNVEPSEWRLMYVAATRTRETLDLSLCAPLADMMRAQVPLPVTSDA